MGKKVDKVKVEVKGIKGEKGEKVVRELKGIKEVGKEIRDVSEIKRIKEDFRDDGRRKTGRPITEAGRIIIEKVLGNPEMGTRTMAQILMFEHGEVFSNLENTRTLIRHYREGNKALGTLPIVKFDGVKREEERLRFHFESDNKIKEDYVLEPGRWGILSDIHYPYQDSRALEVALEFLYVNGVRRLILNGDSIDFYEASDYEKDRSKRRLVDEVYGFRDEVLPRLQKYFDRIVFKIGNHEYRWVRFLRKQAPATFGFEEFRLDVILRLAEKGIGFVDDKQMIRAGKLDIWHGHEIRGGFFIPVNPARSAMVKYKGNIIIGHHHRTSFEPMQLANGGAFGAWSTGCMCDLNPDYFPTAHTIWNHGFAELELEAGGDFQIENYRIINGKVKHS